MLRKIEDDSEVWFVASPKNLDLAMQAGARRFYLRAGDSKWTETLERLEFVGASVVLRSNSATEGPCAFVLRDGQDDAVIPVWTFGDHTLADLDDMIAYPWSLTKPGDDFKIGARHASPHPAQEHRVLIEGIPASELDDFLRVEIVPRQKKTDAVLHVADPCPLDRILPLQLWAFTHTAWKAKGRPILPNGLEPLDDFEEHEMWFQLIGADWVKATATPDALYEYNVRSILWAASNWHRSQSFPAAGTTSQTVVLGRRNRPRDTWLCDTCTVQRSCKFFRSGAVCSVPHAYPGELAAQFQTRDSKTIITGMQALVAANVNRINRFMTKEVDADEPNARLTTLINQTLRQAEALAKMVDPVLAASGAARINIQIGKPAPQQGRPSLEAANEQQSAADAVRALQGPPFNVPMHKITAEMIERFIKGEPMTPALGMGDDDD
jgi:hypothetical protein